jgi:hypothetical protein
VVISEDQRKRNMRQSRSGFKPRINTGSYAVLYAMRKQPLTRNDMAPYTKGMTLKRDLLESFLRDINHDFQAQLDARMEEIRKELEVERRKAIEGLYNVWPQMGGAKEDLDVLATELEMPVSDTSLEARRNGRQSKGSQGERTIPMNMIRQEIQGVLANTEYNSEVTQTYIKDRILSEYPDAKVPSLRSAISRLLSGYVERGELELLEKGKAGSPNRYRKKRTEGNLLEP